MKNTLIAALLAVSCSAFAANEPYVLDSRGDVVMSGTGSCVRTGYWTPALAAQSKHVLVCDKELAPKVAPVAKKVTKTFVLLHDFDKVAPTEKSTEDLKKFMEGMHPSKVEMISVAGFADPIGKPHYNMELSELRAGYVVSMLNPTVFKDKIILQAMGATSSKADCTKVKKFAEKVKCNAPNRQTVVTITTME